MKFIEMTGRTLFELVEKDEFDEFSTEDLKSVGVHEDTIVRVNQQGDIEIRRNNGWDVIGGLLGDFQERIKKSTGLDFS